MIITDESFNREKARADVFYRSVVKVFCPYFDGGSESEVSFNSDGFEHLIYKEWNKTRSREDQYYRFRLLPLAVTVLKQSGTLQEYDEKMVFIRRRSRGTWHKVMKLARYFIFVAIIDDLRIKVVVKAVEGGQMNFHSVYPCWDKRVGGIHGPNRKFFTGDPEND